jgi:integrase
MPSVHKRESVNRSYWYVRYWSDALGTGKQVTRRRLTRFLGYCPTTNDAGERAKRGEITKREAERARNDFFEGVNRSTQAVQSQVPFKDFLETWKLKHVSTLGAGTQSKYGVYLKRYLIPAFGDLRLCDLDTELLQGWINRLPVGWWAKSDVRNILSSVFSKAIDWGYWRERNPAERLTPGKKRASREKRLLSPQDERRLIDALPPECALIVELCRTTGCRISEILGLQWQDVDLAEGWVTIRRRWYRGDLDVVKSDKGNRSLPLGYIAHKLSGRAGASREAFVFDSGNGSPYDDRKLMRDYIRPTARKLGIYFPGLGFHSFRRAAATAIQEAGASTVEAQLYLGHSRPSMTGEYTLLQRARLDKLVKKMQRGEEGEVLEMPKKPARSETSTVSR